MGSTVINKTKDRVSVSYGRKINLGNYESVDVHVGYSTDLKKGESVKEAFERADGVSTSELERLCAPLEAQPKQKKKKGF